MQILLLTPFPPAWPQVLPAPAKQPAPTAPSLPLPPPPSNPSIASLAANPYTEATNYPSLAAAVQPILAEHPQVIAFGEFHPRPGYDYRSAKRAFAEDILPLLAQEGIKDLIVEQILNDPVIIAELDKFYATGKLGKDTTPTLLETFQCYTDKSDLILMLKKARELGIRVHPGGMTPAQADETIHRADWCCNQAVQLTGWQYAEQAMRDGITRLMDSEKRFAIYNGVKHHDLVAEHITEEEGGTNYGEYLHNLLGTRYTEVELYPVGGLRNLSENLLEMWGVPDWQEHAPVSGINQITKGCSYINLY